MDRMLDKRSAADWARAVLKGKDVVIIDTETTGLGPADQICQIGIINLDGETLLDELIKPTIPIPPGATAVHGITNEMVADALGYNVWYPAINRLLNGVHIITYNADYDRRMLVQSGAAYSPTLILPVPRGPWLCAMKEYAKFYGDFDDYHYSYRWQKLGRACEQLRIPVIGAHGAVADCRMTLRVIQAMAEWRESAPASDEDEDEDEIYDVEDEYWWRDPEEGDR